MLGRKYKNANNEVFLEWSPHREMGKYFTTYFFVPVAVTRPGHEYQHRIGVDAVIKKKKKNTFLFFESKESILCPISCQTAMELRLKSQACRLNAGHKAEGVLSGSHFLLSSF